LECSIESPSRFDLLHIAHLVWHLRQHVAIDHLITTLWAMEWLERGIPVAPTAPLFISNHMDLRLTFALLYDAAGVVKAHVRELLFGEHPLMRAQAACTLAFSGLDDNGHTRRNIRMAAEPIVKVG
jgi:hypothetical protein